MDEKGVIKFKCFHQFIELDKSEELIELINYRNIAFQKGYIGMYPNGIGFGNISIRIGNQFLVSGSNTGMIEKAIEKHFSLVTKWDIKTNQLWCKGPVKASSESLTHAVIYKNFPQVKAILHIHSEELWEKYYQELPFTAADIEYGTPEMAQAVIVLLKSGNFKEKGVFLMQGHRDGIVAFGSSLEEVFVLIDNL